MASYVWSQAALRAEVLKEAGDPGIGCGPKHPEALNPETLQNPNLYKPQKLPKP